jgi:hypothetical protein
MMYHNKSSCCVCRSVPLCFSAFARIVLVSSDGMLEDRLEMSRDASFLNRSVVFLTVNVFGSGAMLFIFCVNNFESLYGGAPRQLTTGLIGCPGVCNFISPLRVWAEGIRLVYFHLHLWE